MAGCRTYFVFDLIGVCASRCVVAQGGAQVW
jgi:hypothetical protein